MIKNRLLEANQEFKLIQPGDHVLVGVSGGVDSTALLYLLHSLRDELKMTLHVAHLNHMIRKKDAELDARYVENMAQNLGIPVTIEAVDIAAYSKEKKIGLEEAARKLRYVFFERVTDKIGANKIAVGHSADDNVETFLMRLVRGSGMRGLCGIPPKRGKIIRPLIKLWRKELEFYVGSLKLVPRRDYTNYESKYMRNRVRMKLIPQLKLYNLNIKEIILQTILLLTEEMEYLEDKAEDALGGAESYFKNGEIRLQIDKIREIDPALQNHLLRRAIEKVKGNLNDISYRHIRDILDNLEASERWELHLPGGLFVTGIRGELILSREKPKLPEKNSYRYTLSMPGEIEIKELGRGLRATLIEGDYLRGVAENPEIALVDYEALGGEIVVRSREEGDRFSPLGMGGSKKLQDFFVDIKMPLEDRDRIPIVESCGKIVWVVGLRIDERAKITPQTKKVVKLELT